MLRKSILAVSWVLLVCLVLSSTASAADGLIGWWKFDEGSGTTAGDSSGLGNGGTFGPEGAPQWVLGIKGGAIELDGDDDYVSINAVANDMPPDNNFTVSAWIKTTMTGYGCVIASNNDSSWHAFIFGVDQGYLLVEGDNPNHYGSNLNNGEWHMITYVRDETTAYAYINGEEVGTETPSRNPAGQTRWSIGQEWDKTPSDEYQGLVDDVRFYARSLTAAEVQSIMDTLPPTIESTTASPDVLWPPNHEMVEVMVTVTATDNSGDVPASRIVGVTGPEGTDENPDWEITGDLTVSLRAERSGSGHRTYTIHIECTDAAGNTASGTVDVVVPDDQGRNKDKPEKPVEEKKK